MMKNKEDYQGIYVHIPFCLRKCDYCDFYSIPVKDGNLPRYVKSLSREAGLRSHAHNIPVSTIYLGGGTPNLLSASHISHLLQVLRDEFLVAENTEITMEANPARHATDYFEAIKAGGVNRVSLGVQSFDAQELRVLNRIHDSRDALETAEVLHRVGLANFNIDLIYGIPGQTAASWEKTLATAVSCHPAHISIYLLQLNPVTPMAIRIRNGELGLLDDDREADLYYQALSFLKAQGYEQYEISNLARPGYKCRHNLIYWQARPYTGLGAGAVSFQANQRIMNRPDVEKYMQSIENAQLPPTQLLEEMKAPDLSVDALILGLRMTEGINLADFRQRFGVDLAKVYHRQIDHCVRAGLLNYTDDNIALSSKGYFLSNQVLCQFL
jgi:oxygen-independent coproporphyrinogen-3 oxidase